MRKTWVASGVLFSCALLACGRDVEVVDSKQQQSLVAEHPPEGQERYLFHVDSVDGELVAELSALGARARKVFERDMKNYQDCMKVYLDARKAAIKANETAASDAVDEYNAIMKKIQEDQKQ